MAHGHKGQKGHNLNLLAKLTVLLRQILFNVAIIVIAEAIFMRISAEQVPSVYRVVVEIPAWGEEKEVFFVWERLLR